METADILKDLHQQLSHLDSNKGPELKQLILQYENLFPDIQSRTDKIYRDVDNIEGSKPVKQLYQYKVMPFGMKNSPATFQRLLNNLISNLNGGKADIDYANIFT